MYSIDKNKDNNVEISIHPISKWRRILVFLGDFFIHFIVGVILMNILVMPICSLIRSPLAVEANQAERKRNDILYEYSLLFYKNEENSGLSYEKYNFDSDLEYTCYRFIAFYTFDDANSINPDYPEYAHKEENEVIWTYYHNILERDDVYFDLFSKTNLEKNLFVVTESSVSLKQEVKDELIYFYMPGESMGSKGQEYFNGASDIFYALFGCVIQSIYENDLIDTKGESFVKNQNIITNSASQYYATLAVCSIISFVLSWSLVYVVYPMLNSSFHTPTQSIMKVERLGFKHLYTLNRPEVLITSLYSLVFNLPTTLFLSLSYTTFIYSLKLPVLPILSLIVAVLLIASLVFLLFHPFNRTFVDIFSQSVMVSSDEVDGIIKAKETIKELQISEKKKQ